MENKYKPLMDLLGMQQEPEEKLMSMEGEQAPMSIEGSQPPMTPIDYIEPEEILPEEVEIPGVVPSDVVRESAVEEKVKLSPQEKLLQEFRKYRQEQMDAVQDARGVDDRVALLNNLNKSFVGANKALSSGFANVNPEAIELATGDLEGSTRKDYQDRLQNMLQEFKIRTAGQEDQLSARDRAYLALQERQTALREQELAGRSERQQRSFDQKDIDRQLRAEDKVYKVISDYEKHPVVKELGKQGLSFDQADALIGQMEQGNQIALGALGTKMARAMGEVGVLTDQDVKRYIQAQSLVQKAQDTAGRNFMGELSDETIKDIKDVTSKMKKGFGKKRKDLYDRYVKRAYENYGKQAGLELEDVETRFAMPSMQKAEPEAQSEDPKIQQYAEQYNLSYDRAEKILRSRGYK